METKTGELIFVDFISGKRVAARKPGFPIFKKKTGEDCAHLCAPREFAKVPGGRCTICGVRFLGRTKDSEVMLDPADHYAGAVVCFLSVLLRRNALKSGSTAGSDLPVGVVLRRGGLSQIAPPVVETVPVDVVDQPRRPLPGHPKPRKAVSPVIGSTDVDLSVRPTLGDRPGLSPGSGAAPPNPPREDAGLEVVVEKLPQLDRGEHSDPLALSGIVGRLVRSLAEHQTAGGDLGAGSVGKHGRLFREGDAIQERDLFSERTHDSVLHHCDCEECEKAADGDEGE